MNEPISCLRCHTRMESGFLLDAAYAETLQQNWYPGDPPPSFWQGLKVSKGKKIPVRTFRCPSCGYLESYAVPVSEDEK